MRLIPFLYKICEFPEFFIFIYFCNMKRRLSRPSLASSLMSEIALLLFRRAQFRISCEDRLGALTEGGKTLGVRYFYNVQLELGWHKYNIYIIQAGIQRNW